MADWTVAEPAAGTWTVELARPAVTDSSATDAGTDAATADTVGTAVAPVAVEFTTLRVSGTNPDPREVLGYEQRPYEVTPLRYFEEYAADVDGPVEPVTIAEVADGALSDYDNAVVIHDEGIGDGDYVDTRSTRSSRAAGTSCSRTPGSPSRARWTPAPPRTSHRTT
ncbi:hypothetical protein BRC90_04780 [Halobacteriales archaeon QS_4_69_34]|nr:MAG: hypothetical protein BRC90_04780 [Halobacteriales archaeon QS_4_69_34]